MHHDCGLRHPAEGLMAESGQSSVRPADWVCSLDRVHHPQSLIGSITVDIVVAGMYSSVELVGESWNFAGPEEPERECCLHGQR